MEKVTVYFYNLEKYFRRFRAAAGQGPPAPGIRMVGMSRQFQKRRRAAAVQDAGAIATAPACVKRPGVRQSPGAFRRRRQTIDFPLRRDLFELFHFLHDQHFNRHIGRNEFEA